MLRFPDFRFLVLMILALGAMELSLWAFVPWMLDRPRGIPITMTTVLILEPIILAAAYWSAWVVAWLIFRLSRPQP